MGKQLNYIDVIIDTLEKLNYNVPKTARALKTSRPSIYYHLKANGLKIEKKIYLTKVK